MATYDNLDKKLNKTLKVKFGFDSFRDGQRQVLRSVLTRHNTLAVLPTGSGKTLLYQLPAYLINQPILIVSPLISLMQDQVDRLHRSGEKRVIMLSGNLRNSNRARVLKQLPTYRFIFASPEILATPAIKERLLNIHLGLFVIDEAHCVSQWGPDFRPEYLLLKQLIKNLKHPTVLMLTATATSKVRQDILSKLGFTSKDVYQVIRSVNRPNIFLAAEKFENEQQKQERLVAIVQQLGGRGIIYASSRRKATELAIFLSAKTNLRTAAYHAGIDGLDRYRIQQSFMTNQLDIICATSAFGMGIDKDDVRYVIHYQMPSNLESYVQEIGRAGRDGHQSLALLLNSPGDELIQQTLHHVDLPSVSILNQIKNGKINLKSSDDNDNLINFYLSHGFDGAAIKKLFDTRERTAREKLSVLIDYLSCRTCRRQFIMDYFGEGSLANKPKTCCDIDNHNWQISDLVSRTQSASHHINDLNWEEKIKNIFHPLSN